MIRKTKYQKAHKLNRRQKKIVWDFPGGPAAKVHAPNGGGIGFDPWSRN